MVGASCSSNLETWTGTFSSPGHPKAYAANLNCYWNITVSPGSVIKLTLVALQVQTVLLSIVKTIFCVSLIINIWLEVYKSKIYPSLYIYENILVFSHCWTIVAIGFSLCSTKLYNIDFNFRAPSAM